MARVAKPKPQKSLEARLWEAADALRGNQKPSEYKHVVLGLVFLKYISDRFEERRISIEESLSDASSDDYIRDCSSMRRVVGTAMGLVMRRTPALSRPYFMRLLSSGAATEVQAVVGR
jgi:hypothetical protein